MLGSHEPWHLTVVRTQGVLFLRPEKSWRPIVTVTLEADTHTPYELMLGCDGQNPNLKTPFVLNDVDESSRLDIKLWHKSHRKSRHKRHLVGTAYVTLGDLLKRQDMHGSDVPINLRCPPPQKRSPKLGSTRRSNTVTLTVRIRTPCALLAGSSTDSSESATLAPSPAPTVCDSEDGDYSDGEDSMSVAEDVPEVGTMMPNPSDILDRPTEQGLRRRRKRIKPYFVNSSDEEDVSLSCSSSDEGPVLVTVDSVHQEEEGACITNHLFPILPQHAQGGEEPRDERPLSLVERAVDRFAPYREMRDPGCDFGLVQRRLMGEWYAVAGALLGVAGLNAAVFGFSPGTIFEIDSLAMRSVLFGSVIAAVGLVADIWFLVLFGGADPDKFERVTRDFYSSHFFFCLKCRLPTLCLFLSVCALMFFLLAVAWTAWPTAVLVLCCLAGTLLTLQYLVYGFHRALNFAVWLVQRAWRGVARRALRTSAPTSREIPSAPVETRQDDVTSRGDEHGTKSPT